MKPNLFKISLLLIFCAGLIGCQSKKAVEAKRYDLKGTVVSVDKSNQTATISHEDVKGLMEGMTMPFKLKDAWPLDVMKPGDEVQATLAVADDSAWLENVVVVQKSAAQAVATPENSTLPKAGDAVPDFQLVNQDGKPVRLAQYKGRALLLTFIYTRCPVPDYCALMSSNFAEIERELKKDPDLYKRTHLLSISFDPAYDTPKVLRSYGAAQTGNYDKETFAHWEFVTGEAEEVKKVAQFFGLTYVPEKDQITHTLQTALISPDGKLVKLYSGNEWKPSEVLSDVRASFEKGQQ
ncbi:MAG TPA: SCO family protein [Pyrinomonadaceae bacterium]|nr:SCO family protein [Pyrinomonadaceae bacterium]